MADHLTDQQIASCQDGDGTALEVRHLKACAECWSRLEQIQSATAAYVEYRDSIRGPMLSPTPKPWASLDELIGNHQAPPAPVRTEVRRPMRWWAIPALAAALCGVAVVAVLYRAEQSSRRASELLSQSAQVTTAPGRRISMRVQGLTLIRPAVLTADRGEEEPASVYVRSLFEAAHYSWDEPLSARSFQTWRSGVPHRRDSVTVSGDGAQRSYRVRTENPEGVLRSASLTLRADDLRATGGSLDFTGEGTVEMSDAPETVETPARQPAPISKEKPSQILAGPEDTLRVLAALNRIGADVGEPVTVSEDEEHRHVVVHAGGASRQRQKEIAEAVKPLPLAVVDLRAETGSAATIQPAERYTSSIPPDLRSRLEEKLGGAVALQEATDHVLDSSGLVVARTHAIQVLAEKFPPDVEGRLGASDRELLLSLRQSHLAELQRLASEMRARLKPLLTSAAPASDNGIRGSWQDAALSLATSARETDQMLNRLLAGSYSQSAGEEMLRNLSPQIHRLENAIQSLKR